MRGERVAEARGGAIDGSQEPLGRGRESRREARLPGESAGQRLGAVDRQAVVRNHSERKEAKPGYGAGRSEVFLANGSARRLREDVEKERGEEARAIRRGLSPRGEQDEAPARGRARHVEEKALLARVAGSGAGREPHPREGREVAALLVEEERVGPPRARKELLGQAG